MLIVRFKRFDYFLELVKVIKKFSEEFERNQLNIDVFIFFYVKDDFLFDVDKNNFEKLKESKY